MSQNDIAQVITDEVIYMQQLAYVPTTRDNGKQLRQAQVSCQREEGALGSWILGHQLRTHRYRGVTTRISFGRGAHSAGRQRDTSNQVHANLFYCRHYESVIQLTLGRTTCVRPMPERPLQPFHPTMAAVLRSWLQNVPKLSRTIMVLIGSVHPKFLVFLGTLIPMRSITQENRMGSFFGSLQLFLQHITTSLGSIVRTLPFPWPWVNMGWVLVNGVWWMPLSSNDRPSRPFLEPLPSGG